MRRISEQELAAVPEEHRVLIAQWMLDRAWSLKTSWLVDDHSMSMARDLLLGTAVDLVEPLADDSTVDHARAVLNRLSDL